ncbi:Virulence sensor protein BvgS precursor [Pseudoruegeria aquimaris]|uniref:histidine kinase n=1 Tax=Pseudoruegeria aquimaris TaxID=393663 RepID=A0A1Y5TK94_9RHOB|nr:ATP-binding protein [Pseudoruegeria aquimaris]SLN65886.1 Virulence sensor protein BvgS precursor [Pseudoruegeria aquimaris]
MAEHVEIFRDRDLLPRLAGVGIIFLASAFFLPLPFVAVALGAVALSEIWLYQLRRRAARAGQEVPAGPSITLMLLASVGMMANCAFLAAKGGLTENVLALAILVGALTHTMLIREHSFGERVAKLVPLIAAAMFLPVAQALNGATALDVVVFAFIIAFLLLYLSLAYRVNQRYRAEMAEARARAEAANRAKDEFLAVVSHEIRTPLNGVIGAAQLLQDEPDGPRRKRQLDLLERSARDAERIVTELLDSAKIEAGHFTLAPGPADLKETCAELVELFRGLAEEKDLDLRFDVDPALPDMLEFDKMRVRQCVSNLLSNALKYTDAGHVSLRIGRQPGVRGGVEVRVRDTGAGIARKDQARIFEKYQQIEAREGASGGALGLNSTGLGLPITRQLARQMGGDVTLTSRPGRGSEFVLTFLAPEVSCPASQGAEVVPAPVQRSEQGSVQAVPQPADAGGRGGADAVAAGARVLVVDDNRTNRTIAGAFLRRMGHEGIEADRGERALELLQVERIDLVLLDLNMPGMSGMEMFEAMRALGGRIARTPVIALSAENPDQAEPRVRAIGMDGYVAKPIERRDLEAKITRVLARSRKRAQAARMKGGGAAPALAEERLRHGT